jgi:hypothetical protein
LWRKQVFGKIEFFAGKLVSAIADESDLGIGFFRLGGVQGVKGEVFARGFG